MIYHAEHGSRSAQGLALLASMSADDRDDMASARRGSVAPDDAAHAEPT